MVGNTRTSVSRAAVALKDEGLIDYSRGVSRTLDLPGLQQRSCECYAIVKEHLDNFAEFEDDRSKWVVVVAMRLTAHRLWPRFSTLRRQSQCRSDQSPL